MVKLVDECLRRSDTPFDRHTSFEGERGVPMAQTSAASVLQQCLDDELDALLSLGLSLNLVHKLEKASLKMEPQRRKASSALAAGLLA